MDCPALARCLDKWGCGTSLNPVYYRISVHISRYLVGVAVHDRPKMGVVDQKWVWSKLFRAHYIYFHLCPAVFSHKVGNYVFYECVYVKYNTMDQVFLVEDLQIKF